MAVDLYLYHANKTLRGVAVWGISKLIHDERDFMLTAEIVNRYAVRPGEYVGFACVDGRYRLFKAERAVVHPAAGFTAVTATEAAVAELANSVLPEVRMENATADALAAAVLEGSGFVLGETAQGRQASLSKYRVKRWRALRDIESACGVRIIPYYEMENGRILRKVVDIVEKTYHRTGRILQRQTDATSIQIAYQDGAIARMYGIGASTGTEDPPSCVSFSDVAWSKADGDPMDKPAGQAYLENPDVLAQGIEDEDVFEDKNITDPDVLIEETRKALLKRSRPKVSGTATAFDVAHIPGYEHKHVQMYNILDIPDDAGGTVEGIVIDVQRNYMRPDLTQIVLGEEDEGDTTTEKLLAKVMNQTTSLSGSASAAASRYIENKHLIMLNANRIIMNAEEILANAERITLTASNLERYQNGTDASLNEVGIRMDAYEADLLLYAKQETVDEMGSRLTQAEINIDGANANISLKANATTVDALGERVSSAEIEIDGLNSEITLKADKVTIDAELTTIKKYFAGSATAAKMVVTNLDAIDLAISTNLSYQNSSVDWLTANAVSSSTIPNYEYVKLTRGDGTTGFYYVFTEMPKVQTKQIKYLGND